MRPTFFAWLTVPLLLLISVFGGTVSADGTDEGHARLDPSTTSAQLLDVQSKYAVWLSSELHTDTAGMRAPKLTHRFYLQRLDEREGNLIFQLVDTYVRFIVAVRDDGSMLLVTRRTFYHVPTGGTAVRQDIQQLACLDVYSDGLLVEDWSVQRQNVHQSYPVYYVPYKGGRLEEEGRVLVVAAGAKQFQRHEGLRCPAEPFRSGNILAWVADSTLHTFDLQTRKRATVKLKQKLGESYRVTAFDGSTVVCSDYVFDATTGDLLSRFRYQRRPYAPIVAVRNRIGYYFESGSLMAADLTTPDNVSVRIRDAQSVPLAQDNRGLAIWDGKTWKLIPWLKELPRPRTQ